MCVCDTFNITQSLVSTVTLEFADSCCYSACRLCMFQFMTNHARLAIAVTREGTREGSGVAEEVRWSLGGVAERREGEAGGGVGVGLGGLVVWRWRSCVCVWAGE